MNILLILATNKKHTCAHAHTQRDVHNSRINEKPDIFQA